jgi:uncharacterized membrane protein YdjX (TVP38/TMEM64 family)
MSDARVIVLSAVLAISLLLWVFGLLLAPITTLCGSGVGMLTVFCVLRYMSRDALHWPDVAAEQVEESERRKR